MGVVVAFSYANWVAEFPEFEAITLQQATGLFNRATILHRNDGGGPVSNATIQTELLNLVTAHLAARYLQSQGSASPGSAQDANTPVGRLNNATEGSVSAQFDYGNIGSASQAFWITTKYGADYWMLTKPYRSMRYMAPPPYVANPWPYQ